METSPPVSTLNLLKVLSESRRIIKGQPRHFMTLSFLFILPSSIATAVYLILVSLPPDTISKSFLNVIGFSSQKAYDQLITNPTNALLLYLAYVLFTLFFSICATTSITYSVIHGFSGQPVKLKPAIKSISTNFFPLLGTTLVVQAIATSIAIPFVVIFALLITGARLLGSQIEFSLPNYLILGLVIGIPFLLIVIYLRVNWTLFTVVVVAEKVWGLKALKRSSSLIKGRRWLALSQSLFFAFCSGVVAWSMYYLLRVVQTSVTIVTDHVLKCLDFHLAYLILLTSVLQTILLLYNMAANTVLYLFVHGDKEFAGEYISLPDEDEKAPSLVSFKLDGYKV